MNNDDYIDTESSLGHRENKFSRWSLASHSRRTLAIVFVLALMVGGASAPAFSSALTTQDIQSQISALMAKITELTNQINSLRSQVREVDPSVGSGFPVQHRICNIMARDLAVGSRGDDVRGLQEFLHEQKLLTATPTGYFGHMTADAVKRWQANEGVSAIGRFGPMSRERIKMWCGGSINKERFSATPMRGDAPLSVTFNTWISGFRMNTISYTIEYGDGTSERAADCPAPADACTGPGQNTHTYSQNGTYTAILYKDDAGGCGPNADPRCLGAPASRMAVAKAQVFVGPIACTKEYKPVCGAKPIVCITTPCNPIPTTYGNRCEMHADGASLLYEGQCRTDWQDPANDPRCRAWYDGCNTCSRSAPGQPAMCTLRACAVPGGRPVLETQTDTAGQPSQIWQGKPYCTAWFDTAGNKPPVISGFSGPTTLAVNTSGTWTINASDPEGGTLSYQIWWGDEAPYYAYANSAVATHEFIQSTTFTHVYASAGTYTISMVVRDSAGQEAKTSTTVKVGGDVGVCTTEYAPVCGSLYSYCPPTASCSGDLRNYSNRCMMNAAGAILYREGLCPGTIVN